MSNMKDRKTNNRETGKYAGRHGNGKKGRLEDMNARNQDDRKKGRQEKEDRTRGRQEDRKAGKNEA